MQFRSIAIAIFAAVGIGALAPRVSSAEQQRNTVAAADTTQVLLTLMPRLSHPSARATIVRPVGAGAPDIIFVTAETTPADLNRAIQMLMGARHTFGPTVTREMQAHVPASDVTPMDLADETRYLSDLQTAQELEIPGVGPQKSLFMALEEQH